MAMQQRSAGNLPAEFTSFVGRRRELGEVRRLMGETRLLTLVGVGGVGKTRLGLRAAAEVRRAFTGGVWLVELAPLTDGALLARTVASALGLRDIPAPVVTTALAEHLADRQVLVVLDNCEHLLQPCADLVGELLRRAPGVRVLATSRQPLGVEGERVLPVAPLAVPPAPAPDERAPDVAGEADGTPCEAVQLFEERAAAAVPGFGVTVGNREVVLRVCRRLDGIPLAIELAAVRLRALTVEELLGRLDDRFALLTTGNRAALARQQTLRAAIDWSYELCAPRERVLWARMSVFAGDCDLRAAEQVCAGDAIAPEDVFDLVADLVDKSILTRQAQPAPMTRYRLLETLREYGLERLADSRSEVRLRERHFAFYKALAARAEAEFSGPAQTSWHGSLGREFANLRSALDFCLASPARASDGLALAASLKDYWMGLSLSEARHWLDRGLASHREPDAVRLKGLWVGAWVAGLQGDADAAAAMSQEARSLARSLGDLEALAHVARVSGIAALYRGDSEGARRFLEEALRGHRAAADQGAVVLTLFYLGLEASWRGDDEAEAFCRESIDICDQRQMNWSKSYILWLAGYEKWRRGSLVEAAALLQESLLLQRPIGDRRGYALCTEVLAWVTTAMGRLERGAHLLGCARSLWGWTHTSLDGLVHLIGFHNDCEARLLRELGDGRFRVAFDRGKAGTAEESVGYALEEPVDDGSIADPGSNEYGPSPLTRREAEIAELVADGLSNRDIAARLVISPRTVEAHVEHILAKLAFTSRTQVAAWVVERRDAGRH